MTTEPAPAEDMKATWTPGPWQLAENDPTIILTEWLGADGNSEFVADLAEVTGYVSDRAVANARLIAASPDMYAALEKAAKQFRLYEQLHRAKPDHAKADTNAQFAEECEAALAKARGP